MTRDKILNWLRTTDEGRLEGRWRLADDVRHHTVGDEVHLRGLIELSNFCARSCGYCGIRVENRDVVRYRMSEEEIIDRHTDPWGIKVVTVEVRDVVLPDTMKRAMAKQAETERERRAKVINAEGEFQAAEKLVQAAAMIAPQPIALQLRFLQTIAEMASEHNTTTVVPLPLELFAPLLKGSK